jgi:lysophospholipase L1-like esterase
MEEGLESKTLLALGDSYTIGESVGEEERWPNQLVNLLRERGIADFAKPEIVATTGWTTGELADSIRAAEPQGPFGLVTLLIGVNNQFRGRGLEEYRDQFRDLLQTAIHLAGDRERVLVLSIPDWGVTPFAEGRDRARIAAEIDAFNAVNREEALEAGVRYVDVTPVSRRAAAEPALVAVDGLHPSGQMYREWAELLVPVAAHVLGAGDLPG